MTANDDLFRAIERGDMRAVEAALAAGADVAATDALQRTPLVCAVEVEGAMGRRIVRALHGAGASMAWTDSKHGWGVLMHAAAGRADADMLKLLLSLGADPNATTAWSETPLHRALRDKAIDKALILAEHAPDGDARSDGGPSLVELVDALEADVSKLRERLAAKPPTPGPENDDARLPTPGP